MPIMQGQRGYTANTSACEPPAPSIRTSAPKGKSARPRLVVFTAADINAGVKCSCHGPFTALEWG